MGKRKGRKGLKSDGDDQQYNYGPGGGLKKKRVIKLSRKQLKRKSDKRERGEGVADRRSRKTEKDLAKADRKAASKELW